MKYLKFFLLLFVILGLAIVFMPQKSQSIERKGEEMSKELTAEEKRVMIDKGTEAPFSGKFNKHSGEGVYTCKNCDAPLFESAAKFDSGTGWPSFDEYIEGAVKTRADGNRAEIVCSKCGAHLGHLFEGEGFTEKNARNCVNS